MRKSAEEIHFSDVCMLVFAIVVANNEQHQPKDLVDEVQCNCLC